MSCSLTLKDISLKKGNQLLCSALNLQVGHKEKVALWGSNGCGKTTLLETIAGLRTPHLGEIELFHHPIKSQKDYLHIRSKIGYLFQDSDNQFLAPIVQDDVAFGLLATGAPPNEAAQKTEEILKSLGIFHLRNSTVYKLSGGEKKLVALAGVLVNEPHLLLLDEPTNGLDITMQEKLVNLLSRIDKSMIIVSHQCDFLDMLAHKIFVMNKEGLSLLPSSSMLAPSQCATKKANHQT